jgi:shikimate kinase
VRIYLIGLPGSGKSTFGNQLAQALQYSFIDLDKVIADKTGRTIPELFREFGEDYFRKLEAESLRIHSLQEHLVMATGGGAPCFYDGIKYMNAQGKTVYLRVHPRIISQRLAKTTIADRPLLNTQTEEETYNRLLILLDQREPVYQQAEIQLEENEITVDEVIRRLGIQPV